ncbi:MAG TPA: isoprenylcysteine carboxylmethyltransferase family protein [Phycisphaerae bacterium]|nr:isoprenylcysteine carboxylmethyltransferase family protein [Phycisphaerae bacterium]
MKGVVYTLGFLILILGVVPSLFYFVGEKILGNSGSFSIHIREFWISFRMLLGAAIFAIGIAAYVFCSAWLIGFGKGPHVEFDPPKVFVATGPYRWVRNPVVISLITAVVGEGIYLGSMGILVLVLLGILFAQYQVTLMEEPRLRNRFGQSYIDYCNRVHRWIPKWPGQAA